MFCLIMMFAGTTILQRLFNKISQLSESVEIYVSFDVELDHVEDFVKTACSLR